MLHALIFRIGFYSTLSALAWTGFALEAFFLWWLPAKIAAIYTNFYLSWTPHNPMKEQGRYRATRAFKSKLGNLGSFGMQYHIIHHLYPTIPLNRHPAVFRVLKPILLERGVEIGDL